MISRHVGATTPPKIKSSWATSKLPGDSDRLVSLGSASRANQQETRRKLRARNFLVVMVSAWLFINFVYTYFEQSLFEAVNKISNEDLQKDVMVLDD